MRFLVDQGLYQVTIDVLKAWGHEVITARDLNMQTAADEELLDRARFISATLVTRDKDFGVLSALFCVVEPKRYRVHRL
jgi:predicted nuclease of predicted toxin-antitoxin system